MKVMAERFQIRAERGQTLVELLVVMFMMGLLLAGITSIFVSSMQSQSKLTNEFNAVENLHTGVDLMRKDVNLACSSSATAATATNSVTLTECKGSTNVTWCTSGSGTLYSLYRYTSGSTCANGIKYATYLTSGTIFTYYGANYNAGSYSLPFVHLNLSVNANPSTSQTGYRDVDDLAFRNGTR
jgi:type II secretory pathway pseudopilin PulG